MKIHRFIGAYQLGIGALRIDDADLAHQMRSVLKLAPGEMVMIGDGSGREVQCRIAAYDRHAVVLEGLAIEQNANEPRLQTTLYCAVLKAENFELAAQKATEVGVSEVVPLITKRTVKLHLRTDRVERIVREAAELAGRGRIPTVREPQPIEAVLTHASAHDVNVFFDPSGKPFHPLPQRTQHAGIWIGPEGGWDASEIALAEDYGMRIASLGSLVLRAETAVTVASYLVAQSVEH